jgi:sugar/nucleoside kinase (ribokinase family)
MTDIICVGSLTLDLFFQDESLTVERNRFFLAIGGKYVVNYFSQAIGGGGGNVAVGLARAGVKSALFTEIGTGGVSQLILAKLHDEGVNTQFLEKRPDLTNVSAILLSPSGERTIINHRSHKSKLDLMEHGEKLLTGVKTLYLGNMPEVALEERQKLLKLAKSKGLFTYLNLGVKDCRRGLTDLKEIFETVDNLIINRYELADILGVPANELVPRQLSYREKIFSSKHSLLVITDGEYGSYAQGTDGIVHQAALKVKQVIDATGAGDAFTSGFIAARLEGLSLQDSLRSGARNSASVIQKINAQDGLLGQEALFKIE